VSPSIPRILPLKPMRRDRFRCGAGGGRPARADCATRGRIQCRADTFVRVAAVFRTCRNARPTCSCPRPGLGRGVCGTGDCDGQDVATIHAALGEWALDAEGEPLETHAADCQRFQDAMTRGTLRLYAADQAQCTETCWRCNVSISCNLPAGVAGGAQPGRRRRGAHAADARICRIHGDFSRCN